MVIEIKRKLALLLMLAIILLSGCGGRSPENPLDEHSRPEQQSAVSEEFSGEEREQIIRCAERVLARYRTGEYPENPIYASDALQYSYGWPSGVELPKTVAWTELSVSAEAGNSALYDRSLTVILPLEGNYEFHMGGGYGRNGWELPYGFFRDLREEQEISSVETEFGIFNQICGDRLRLYANVTDLRLDGFPEKNKGSFWADIPTGRMNLSLTMEDGSIFWGLWDGEGLQVEGIPLYEPPLSDNEQANALFHCQAMIWNLLTADHLSEKEHRELCAIAEEALQKYRTGEYPLDIVLESEYFLNDPVPEGIVLPGSLPEDVLVKANGGDGMFPLLLTLPLEKGYSMLFYLSPSLSGIGFTLNEVRFADAEGALIPHPAI